MHLEEGGGAVGDDAVALHLSETQATIARTALHRLPRQDLNGAATPAVTRAWGKPGDAWWLARPLESGAVDIGHGLFVEADLLASRLNLPAA